MVYKIAYLVYGFLFVSSLSGDDYFRRLLADFFEYFIYTLFKKICRIRPLLRRCFSSFYELNERIKRKIAEIFRVENAEKNYSLYLRQNE